NWVWWGLLPSGMLTVYVFAKLWRRAEVMTDVEFYELRYSDDGGGELHRIQQAVQVASGHTVRRGAERAGGAAASARCDEVLVILCGMAANQTRWQGVSCAAVDSR
ncbi:MAG: hypothetical protein WBC15_11400, partial [Mycobacterium sp.]